MKTITLVIDETFSIPNQENYIHRSQDGGIRLRQVSGGFVLEESRYSNKDASGAWLQYPAEAWIPVPIIT